LIGKNSRGNWVVQDQQHRFGGLFINRTAALRFVLFENGNRPEAVIMVPDIVELDLNSSPHVSYKPVPHIDASRDRRTV
jgi:hypothetical protein